MAQLLSKSHSDFLWDSYETDYDKTLNDLIYLLGTAESAMIWKASKANLIRRSTSKTLWTLKMMTLEIQKKKHSLPNRKGSAIVNLVDQMIKRKVKSVIVPVPLPNGPYVYIAIGRGISCEAAKFYLRMLKSISSTLLQVKSTI